MLSLKNIVVLTSLALQKLMLEIVVLTIMLDGK